MSRRDTIGLVVLIVMFVMMGIAYVLSTDRPSRAKNSFRDNAVVRQMTINQNK